MISGLQLLHSAWQIVHCLCLFTHVTSTGVRMRLIWSLLFWPSVAASVAAGAALSPPSGVTVSVHRLRWTEVHLFWKYLSLSFGHTGGTGENLADLEKNAEGFFSSLSRSSCWHKDCAGGQLPLVLCHTSFRYLHQQQQYVATGI